MMIDSAHACPSHNSADHHLTESVTSIGRKAHKCKVVVPDKTISQLHCIIERTASPFDHLLFDQCFVIDQHSTNGTFLNGARLKGGQNYLIDHKDVLRLGDCDFVFNKTRSKMTDAARFLQKQVSLSKLDSFATLTKLDSVRAKAEEDEEAGAGADKAGSLNLGDPLEHTMLSNDIMRHQQSRLQRKLAQSTRLSERLVSNFGRLSEGATLLIPSHLLGKMLSEVLNRSVCSAELTAITNQCGAKGAGMNVNHVEAILEYLESPDFARSAIKYVFNAFSSISHGKLCSSALMGQLDKDVAATFLVALKKSNRSEDTMLDCDDLQEIVGCDQQLLTRLCANSFSLHRLCREGALDNVKEAINNSHSILYTRSIMGRTALHEACEFGHAEVAKHLLSCLPTLINERDHYGCTPIHLAVAGNHTQVVVVLLNCKSDECNTLMQRKNKETALHLAASRGHIEVLRELFARAPNDCELCLDMLDSFGSTPFLSAVSSGSVAAVQLLARNGAKVDAFDRSNKNALAVAVESGASDVLKVLLTMPSVDVDWFDVRRRTPFMIASELGAISMMKDLIAAGCGTELRDAQRRTPFLIAVAAGQEDAVRLLASDHILHTSDFCGSRTVAAVDVNACDSCGNSALMLAALHDDVTLGRTLLDIGCCNTNAQNINGKTAKDLTLSPEFRVVLSSAVTAEHRDELLD